MLSSAPRNMHIMYYAIREKIYFFENYKGEPLKCSPIDFTKFILVWKRKLSLMDYMNKHFRVTMPVTHCTLTTLPWTSFSILQDPTPFTNFSGLIEYYLLTSSCALDHLIIFVILEWKESTNFRSFDNVRLKGKMATFIVKKSLKVEMLIESILLRILVFKYLSIFK